MTIVDQIDPPHQTLPNVAMDSPQREIARSIRFDNGASLIELANGPIPSSRLVVTFAPPEMCDINGFGYFEHILTSAGFDVLSIKQQSNTGYIDLELDTIVGILDGLPRYDSYTVLGTDAGATAAMRLFSSFEGFKILSLSPDMTVDCTLTKPVQADALLIYDPTIPTELANLRTAKTLLSRAKVVAIPYAGVPSRYALEETGTLIELVTALADGRVLDVNRHFRGNRNSSPTALLNLGRQALKGRHFKAAQTLLKRSYDIDHRQEAGIFYCHALRESGQQEAAARFMRSVVQREQDNAHLWAVQSYFEEMAGQRDEALVSVKRAIKMLPEFEAFHIAERRLLTELYNDVRLRQNMTEAALDKTRAEIALLQGHEESDFTWQRMAWFIVGTISIVLIVIAITMAFRLV